MVTATLAGKLDEVLALIAQSDRAMTLAPVFDTSADEDKHWPSHYGRKLSNEAQARWEIFLTRLFEAVPRELSFVTAVAVRQCRTGPRR